MIAETTAVRMTVALPSRVAMPDALMTVAVLYNPRRRRAKTTLVRVRRNLAVMRTALPSRVVTPSVLMTAAALRNRSRRCAKTTFVRVRRNLAVMPAVLMTAAALRNRSRRCAKMMLVLVRLKRVAMTIAPPLLLLVGVVDVRMTAAVSRNRRRCLCLGFSSAASLA